MNFLYFYYIRYIYPGDPTGAQFKFTLRCLLAMALGVAIAEFHSSHLATWLIFSIFIFNIMIDLEHGIWQRCLNVVYVCLLTMLVVFLMALAGQWFAGQVLIFLLCGFLGTYVVKYGAAQARLGLGALIFAVLSLRLMPQLQDLGIIYLYMLIAVALTIFVNVLVWPDTYHVKFKINLNKGTKRLQRYLNSTLLDASLGYRANPYRQRLKGYMLEHMVSLDDIHTKLPADKQAVINQFSQLVYTCIAIDAALVGLSRRACFHGPFTALQCYANKLCELMSNQTLSGDEFISALQIDYENLTRVFEGGVKQLESSFPQVIIDYQHWRQVFWQLERLHQQWQIFLQVSQGNSNADS
jgi:hypothetical protein